MQAVKYSNKPISRKDWKMANSACSLRAELWGVEPVKESFFAIVFWASWMEIPFAIKARKFGSLALSSSHKCWGSNVHTNFFQAQSSDMEWVRGRRQGVLKLHWLLVRFAASLVLGKLEAWPSEQFLQYTDRSFKERLGDGHFVCFLWADPYRHNHSKRLHSLQLS